MGHFLLVCAHTRRLDDVDEAEVAELAASPDMVPRYVWCDTCSAWQLVAELVPGSRPEEPAAAGESRSSESDVGDLASLAETGPIKSLGEPSQVDPVRGVGGAGPAAPPMPSGLGWRRSP